MIVLGIIAAGVFIGSEIYFERRSGNRVYFWRATGSHVALSMGQQAVNVMTFAGFAILYGDLFARFRMTTFDEKNPLLWVLAALLADLAYYWAHRMGHRVNFFAASHLIHHQAKDFNHLSALRQSWFTRIFMFGPYLALAVLGIPTKMLLAGFVVSHVVQFWSHNGVIRRHLGFVEYFLVTPRSHRAHHGTNAPYLDKNFAGAFIFWDRLFGTYQDVIDSNPVVIGGGAHPCYFDPGYSQFSYWKRLYIAAGNRRGIFPKIALWFGTPETLDAELAEDTGEGKAPKGTASDLEAGIWFILLVAATLTFMNRYTVLQTWTTVGFLAVIFFAMGMAGKALSRTAVSRTPS
jgi:alkylglycerol monooxygenase